MKIEIEIPDNHLEFCIGCALDGGSSYWLASTKCELSDSAYPVGEVYRERVPFIGGKIHVTIQEPFKKDGPVDFVLTRKSIERGLAIMQSKNPYQFGLLISENGDATTHDVLLQFALFGEEIYG